MLQLLEWIVENGYVVNKDDLWYKTSEYPRVYLKSEQLIEIAKNKQNGK